MPAPLHRDLDALSSGELDVCVIGGGISGLCVAHDAASRGLSVALLERGDFAQGASSASSKLIHGGTRYLERGDLSMAREALRERRVLMRLAPHQVRVLNFMVPLYKGALSASLTRTGLLLHEALGYDKNWKTPDDKRMDWHKFMPPQAIAEVEPHVRFEGLRGASIFQDGQALSPMRLCLEIAKSAVRAGARLANYAQVTGLLVENGRVAGVQARDRLGGRDFAVRARMTVNCTGIWSGEVMKLLGKPPPVQLSPSKGVHFVTRPLTHHHALTGTSAKGRQLLITPWRGKSLVGVTDDFYDGPLDRIRPTAQELTSLLEDVNAFLPSARLTLADVEHAYAGARPLINRPGRRTNELSHARHIYDHGRASKLPGMLSVVGGDLTTSRSMAEEVTDLLLKQLGRSEKCQTEHLPIGGGDVGAMDDFLTRQHDQAAGLIDDECLAELVQSHGSAWIDVLDYVRKDQRLGARIVPDRPFVLASIHHAVEHEMASCIADVALRRTDVGNLGDPEGRAGRVIGAELQRLLGLSDEQLERQLAEYLDQIAIDGLEARPPAEQQGA